MSGTCSTKVIDWQCQLCKDTVVECEFINKGFWVKAGLYHYLEKLAGC
jgi:hypothetical protein